MWGRDGVGMGGAEWWWGLCACPQHRQSSSFGSTVVGRWLCWPCCPSRGCVVPLWGSALWKGPRDRGQRVFGGREQGWGLGSCPAGCSHNLGGDALCAGCGVSVELRGHRGAWCCRNRPASPRSYRRFCRLDDVSAQYWSRSWLASASSLDNPAFTHSEELLHLQVLDNGCCGCREAPAAGSGPKQRPAPPARPAHRPR